MEFRLHCLPVFLLLISSSCFGMKKKDDSSYINYLKSFYSQREEVSKEIEYYGKFDDFKDRFDKIDKDHYEIKNKFEESDKYKKLYEQKNKEHESLQFDFEKEKKTGNIYKNITAGVGAGALVWGGFKLYGYLKKN